MFWFPHLTDNVEEIGRTGISEDDYAYGVYRIDKGRVGSYFCSFVELFRRIHANSDCECDERSEDRDKAYPADPCYSVKCLDGGERADNNPSNDYPNDRTCCVERYGIEGDGDGEEGRSGDSCCFELPSVVPHPAGAAYPIAETQYLPTYWTGDHVPDATISKDIELLQKEPTRQGYTPPDGLS